MSFRSFIFGFKQIARPISRSLVHELRVTERLSVDEIVALNWKRRMALLATAGNAPFYRRRFKEIGLSVGDVKTEKDWERIPVLTRKDIQDHAEEMICDGVGKRNLCISSTGGSTGEPLRLYRSKKIPYEAFTARMLKWWNVEMWDDSCYIFRHGYRGWRKAVNDFMWWPTRRAFLNAGNMNDENCEEFYRRICKIYPTLVVGYVGAVSAFSEFLEKNNYAPPRSIKAVWTTAAPLPNPLRVNLQSVFNAPVYSQYGCCECGHLAAECSCRDGMHIHSDWRHIEFVDAEGRNKPIGEVGDVLITDMYCQEVPLIRYALGDHGSLRQEKCSCGINLPMMEPVRGRVSESFPLPDGSRVSGDYLTTIFDNHPDSIRGFRVHQNRDYSIRIEYVPRGSVESETAVKDAMRNLSITTKGLVGIDFVAVSSIPHDRGKTRYVTTDITAV